MDQLAAKSAAFYESLHAHFVLVFNGVTDRDAGFYQDVEATRTRGGGRPTPPPIFAPPGTPA
jgi:hypothetical protein